jgi:hypothetical protein
MISAGLDWLQYDSIFAWCRSTVASSCITALFFVAPCPASREGANGEHSSGQCQHSPDFVFFFLDSCENYPMLRSGRGIMPRLIAMAPVKLGYPFGLNHRSRE